ncbi:MAG: TrkH family potassium uptake protein [Eubacterium sp.]|nr:TrkH family potassium uptake protein [Eubacterium sp.]
MSSSINHNSLLRMLGVLFIVLGISFIPPVCIALIYSEYFEGLCFGATMTVCTVAGLLLMKFFNPSGLKTKQRDGFLIVTLIWILSSIIGAVPMVLTGAIPNPVDAFFELCSGFSTTGATIMDDIESQAKSVLFWRSFTHWLGGMGIVVLATALLPSIGIGGQNVAVAETPGPTLTKLTARFSDNSKTLYKLYILFTVAEFILLLFGGMSAYDSAIHTFGTVGTGGFSNYGDSVGHFTSPYIQWVIIIFMGLCGINFNLYFLLPRKRFRDFFADEELRLYLTIVFLFSFASAAVLMIQGDYTSISKAIRDAFFHIIAVITTTGYATADFDLWPAFCKMLIFIVMITGACSSSTGGGAKIIRALAAIKFVKRGFFQKLHPNMVINMTINRMPVQQSVVTNIINFIFMYIAVMFAGTLLIAFDGYDLVTSFSAALTCISNVGPGFNAVGPSMNFSGFSDFSTFVLAILMIAGRLELFTFFVLFSPKYWNSNRA